MAWGGGGFYFAGPLIRRAFVSIFFSTENKKSLFLLNVSVGNVDANVVHTSTTRGGGDHTAVSGAPAEKGRQRTCGGGGGGWVGVASFGALSFNGDVIRKNFSPPPLKWSSASDWRQPSKERAPVLPPS